MTNRALSRCVFGEMFKRRPILAGNSDLNQAQLIFALVGTPTEETMPGYTSLPGCDGIKDFGNKPGNLNQVFKEYEFPHNILTYLRLSILTCRVI